MNKPAISMLLMLLAIFLLSCQRSNSIVIKDDNLASNYYVKSINVSNDIVYTNSLVDLTYSTSNNFPSNLVATWRVDNGSFITSPPDIWQQTRGLRAINTSTTGYKVTLLAPSQPATLKIYLEFNDEFKTHFEREIEVYANPVKLISTTETTTGNLILTAKTDNVKNLYQIAFRVMFDPEKYKFDRVNAGNFFAPNERLFLGHQVDDGTIAVALSLKGAVAGKNGSGELATIVLKPIIKSNSTTAYWLNLEAARNPNGSKITLEN